MGCGGVGGVTAAGLASIGVSVTAITGNDAISKSIVENGLRLDTEDGQKSVKLPAVTSCSDLEDKTEFDVALFATPPNYTRKALEDALPLLAKDAPCVFFQNGLAEERALEVLDDKRVVGSIVSFGASMHGPGHVERTSQGGYVVGRLNGEHDEVVQRVIELLQKAQPAERAPNLRGSRWSKLAINCAISSLGTIGGDRLGTLMRHRFVRRLCLETMTEVTQIALAEGVSLEKVSGTLDLEWLSLDDDERKVAGSPTLFAKHTVLLAVGAKYRRLRSSMLGAIERGREPSVDFLNGEIVVRGEKHGISVPINQALQEEVHRISRGESQSSLETLRDLFDRTRDQLRALDLVA
ncbi:MAG: 2-dehydropantoate 2-reductase [Deltaproteobacteria bacterium]|nr:2-dehydropantoate 2-reductase [Deltaproteobacteria bacterium]